MAENDVKFQIRLPAVLRKRLRAAAKRRGIPLAVLVRDIMAEAML